MNAIDWTDTKIITAIITGLLTIVGTIVAALLKKSRGAKHQGAILSRNVTQIQSDGEVTISDSRKKSPAKMPRDHS